MKKAAKSKLQKARKGFACLKCGYEAYKLAALSHCPLCVICKGCGQNVGKCKCREGE